MGVALATQSHPPQPSAAQAGRLWRAPILPGAPGGAGPAVTAGLATRIGAALAVRDLPAPVLPRSRPVRLSVPAIGLTTGLLEVGRNPNGTLQVPPLYETPGEAAWYTGSPTPGQPGPSVIVGHVDSVLGPAVFFRLGDVAPGDRLSVTLADGAVARFVVDGVRVYPKSGFPTAVVFGPARGAQLRLVTCGGPFDYASRHYLDNIVVFASLLPPRLPGS